MLAQPRRRPIEAWGPDGRHPPLRPDRDESRGLRPDQARSHRPARSRIAAWATGRGHDQTRKKRAWRAQRWAGSDLRKPLPLRAVRWAWVQRRARAFAWARIAADVG